MSRHLTLGAVAVALTGCSADVFVRADGGALSVLPDGAVESDANPGWDGGRYDAQNEDAQADAAETDAGPSNDAASDAPCATGTQACDNVIIAYCARLKSCCAGQCPQSWQNTGGAQCIAQFSTGGCPGKMVCETQCLADMQAASCATIKNAPSPPYVAGSCWNLWQ